MALTPSDRADEPVTKAERDEKGSDDKFHTTVAQTWGTGSDVLIPPALSLSTSTAGFPQVGFNGRDNAPPLRLASSAPISDYVLPAAVVSRDRQAEAGEQPRPPILKDTSVSAQELAFVSPALPEGTPEQKSEHWRAVKELVNGSSSEPMEAILSAASRSQLIGIGDHHVNGLTPVSAMYEMLKTNMKDLARVGVTDMFIEYPHVLQPLFDAFNKDPQKGDLVLPTRMTGADGAPLDTPEARGGLKFLAEHKKSFPQLVEMWRAARDAGIRINAVDSDANALSRSGDMLTPERSAKLDQLNKERDKSMTQNMLDVLSATDNGAPRKGLALLGGYHISRQATDFNGESAFGMLEPKLDKTKGGVTTFAGLVGSMDGAGASSLQPLTTQIERPVVVPTRDSSGNPNALAAVNFLKTDEVKLSIGSFDNVLLFPDDRARAGKFTQDSARELLKSPDLATPAGEQFRSLVDGKISWGQMPPAQADNGGFVAKQVLDKMWFNNGGEKPAGWDALQNSLGVPSYESKALKDIKYVVIDSRGTWDHGAKVQSALKSGDPGAGDRNIVNLWLPTVQASVPPRLAAQGPLFERAVRNEAQGYGLLVQQDLERATKFAKNVVAAGGEAPAVILPQTTSPYYLGEGNPLAITPNELGVEPASSAYQADAGYKQRVLAGLERLSQQGDTRATSVLETLATIKKLADVAPVYLSANNEDRLDLGVFLGDMHPNVVSVSSIGRDNKTAEYNSETAQFAKNLALGSVVSIPENLKGDLDMKQFAHVITREPDESDTLAGNEVKNHTVNDEPFKALLQEQKAFLTTSDYHNLGDHIDRARGTLRYEGELPEDMVEAIAKKGDLIEKALALSGQPSPLFTDFSSLSGEQRMAAVRKLLEDGPASRKVMQALATAEMASLRAAGKDVSDEQVKAAGDDPTDDEGRARVAYGQWYDKLEQRVGNMLLTFQQMREFHGAARPEHAAPPGEAPANLRNLLFNANGPLAQSIKEYLPTPTKSGKLVALGIEVGNSFSAPYLAARERFMRNNSVSEDRS